MILVMSGGDHMLPLNGHVCRPVCRHSPTSYVRIMPAVHPPIPPASRAPLNDVETRFITETIKRFFGDDAIVRSFGPDPARLALHVETSRDIGMAEYDCLGELMTRIDRDQISLDVTRRGTRVFGNAKLAYRQGAIL
jgi:hypothetical protein